jgi:hypothetical protein
MDTVDSYGFAQIRRFQPEDLSDYLRNLLETGLDEGQKNFGPNNFQVVKVGSVCDGYLLRAGKWMERGRSIPSPFVIDTLLVCGRHSIKGNAVYDVITIPMPPQGCKSESARLKSTMPILGQIEHWKDSENDPSIRPQSSEMILEMIRGKSQGITLSYGRSHKKLPSSQIAAHREIPEASSYAQKAHPASTLLPGVQTLILEDCLLNQADVKDLCSAIGTEDRDAELGPVRACTLRRVILSNNLLGDEGAALFADAVRRNPRLEHVHVALNRVANAGAQAISPLRSLPRTAISIHQQRYPS